MTGSGISELLYQIEGIFTGVVKVTFLVILLVFVLKLLFEIISEWLLKGLKKYLKWIFLPGSFMHTFSHALAIRFLGYDVRVNFHMSFTLDDMSSMSLSGDLKNTWHAFLIGFAPLLNIVVVLLLIQFHESCRIYFEFINFPPGEWLIIYLKISFILFALPDFGDITLLFVTATAKHTELLFLAMVSFFCYVIAIPVWGYLIPSINYALFNVVLLYLAKKRFFTRSKDKITKSFDTDSKSHNR